MILISTRNTLQKSLILAIVTDRTDHPTAEEIHAQASKDCPTISLATVYRVLNQLTAEGVLCKLAVPGTSDRFGRVEAGHSHFRCLRCGRIFDLAYPCPADFSALEKDGLEVTGCELIFVGYCKNCKEDVYGQQSAL